LSSSCRGRSASADRNPSNGAPASIWAASFPEEPELITTRWPAAAVKSRAIASQVAAKLVATAT
jgi:hypothetical protein